MERSSVIITLLKIGLSNIRLPQTSLAFHQNRTIEVKKPALKQENGFGFRLESGKSLLLEKDGTKAYEIKPTTNNPNGIILESNKNTLLENGKSLLLEKDGTKAYEIKPTTNNPNGIILESNKNTLLESGSSIKQ